MSERLPDVIREIAAEQAERLAEVVAALSDADLAAPTLCAGWLAAHLLAHVRLGLAEQAASFAEPAGPGDAIDRDYVSYWRDFRRATGRARSTRSSSTGAAPAPTRRRPAA